MLTVQILITLALGIFCGKLYPAARLWQAADSITALALYALLFLIGIELGQNRQIWHQISTQGWRILLLPCAIATGTLAGGGLAGWLLAIPVRKSLAVSSGFGWYSLASVMISQMGYVELGALAFLVNILRELLAMLCIPLVARYLGSIPAIAPGGATAMDTTLPLIAEATNNEGTVAAFLSGAILSALVPVLIPFLIAG
ncbi:MAG: lysine exporter LysO family protein [Firmicutes bacterium]|nr:lysine exporter LysO family protein [Bacillota bacterium]